MKQRYGTKLTEVGTWKWRLWKLRGGMRGIWLSSKRLRRPLLESKRKIKAWNNEE